MKHKNGLNKGIRVKSGREGEREVVKKKREEEKRGRKGGGGEGGKDIFFFIITEFKESSMKHFRIHEQR